MRTRLRPGEQVAAVVRRHWIVLVGPFTVALFLAGALVAALFIRRPYVAPAAGAALAVAALWAGWRWLDWQADLWAVTSQRVVDESGVLAVRQVDTPLDTIHNVTSEQSIWGRMMGFGDLNLQTAAEHGSTTIHDVTRPQDLRDTILEMKERYKDGLLARQAGPLAAAIGRGAGTARPGAGADGGAETRECPYCAEIIKARATVCRFCGRTI
jgi:membrane protein YdbS with pleckstrin-like domain